MAPIHPRLLLSLISASYLIPQSQCLRLHHPEVIVEQVDLQKEFNQKYVDMTVNSLTNNLKNFAKQIQGRPLILMFGNMAYRETIMNQMVGFHTLNITNYAVICMDDELNQYMQSIGRPCQSAIGSGLPFMREIRLKLIDNMLKDGTGVLLTDADAIWMKNPMDFLKGADMVMQRGTFPIHVFAKLGATACMGFAYFAGNPTVSDFFHTEILKRYYDTKNGTSDQQPLNNALMDNGIHFDKRLANQGSRKIDSGIVPAKGNRRELHVDFLDDHRFPRKCETRGAINADTYVAHCLTSKNGKSKISKSKDMGLYWLTEDWKSIQPSEDFEAFMTAITEPSKKLHPEIGNS